MNDEIKKLITEYNNYWDITNRCAEYFNQLDNWKNNNQNKLKEKDINNIKKLGYDNYCKKIFDKYDNVTKNIDNVIEQLIKKHNFIFSKDNWKGKIKI